MYSIMNNYGIFIIFVIIFFFYFHVINQYKTSEDLEIFELDYLDNDNLQETCEIKQPVVFKRGLQNLPDITNYNQLLNVKAINDYKNEDTINSIELPCNAVMQLFQSDINGLYFSENNSTFIDETILYKVFTNLDTEFQPKFITMSNRYDILMGSQNCSTPLRYHKHSRKFIYVVQGTSIRIKMTPWKFTKYLHEIKDFENLEYRSSINVWDNSNVFENDLNRVQFIEIDLPLGSIIHIPNYWWYSIKYNYVNTILLECNYTSYINKVSNIFDYGLHFLQKQNTNIIKGFAKNIDDQDENENENENENVLIDENENDLIDKNENENENENENINTYRNQYQTQNEKEIIDTNRNENEN